MFTSEKLFKDELKNVEKLPHYLKTRLAEIGFENGLRCVNSCPLVSQELAACLCLLIHEQDRKVETVLYNTVINLVYTHGFKKLPQELPIGVPEVNWSILLGESYERLNSSAYCSTANGLAEKIVEIVKTKFKHLTSNAIPFFKLISYALREINHQFRRSGKTLAAKFFGMTAYLKLYKKSLGLPESTNSTPIYFKKSRKKKVYVRYSCSQVRTPNLDDSRLLLRCLCSIQGLHTLPRKRMLHVEGHIHDYISVKTAVPEEDVGYISNPDKAAFSSQFEAVAGHDDGLLHLKNDDVANDELSSMKILEKEL
uniref:Retrovirus-related Pol polyprotein from transposon TNT 1-94 n=1 Tax=Strongyloides venezuelensis TaxID=75913 RepID=A0A0K0FRI3_STRVS